MSLYLLVFQKYSKASYKELLIFLILICGLLGISNADVLYISIARSYHGLSVLSLLLETAINIFNLIRKPILETPEQIQKTYP